MPCVVTFNNSSCAYERINVREHFLSRFSVPLIYVVFIWTLLLAVSQCHAQSTSATSRLVIEGSSTSQNFFVELAVTRSQKSMGLMYRRSLPQKNGMLFVYKPNSKISMWMKNTYLALDMLFINSRGRINYIHEAADPLSEKLITGKFPARAVLELNAGAVSRFGITVGDLVRHQIFFNE
ncbi:MAG: hypothetical protein CMM41_08575 [Rhodospirillaceae bacterium]|mgnify:FL=1|nr:hypothetical protein [Rhodospirillaceae bacterium]